MTIFFKHQQAFGSLFRRLGSRMGHRFGSVATSPMTSPSMQNGFRLLSALRKSLMADGNGAKRIVGHWLIGSSGAVFGIVVLGGLTRLTESGLSMVDWNLIHFLQPQNEAEWQAYFEKYQQFPEYQLNNRGMTLEEFKKIYWMEHAHRVYGRLLGLGIMVPSVFFIAKKWTSPGIRNVLIGCCGLVGFQGLLGWYMVKSGLKREILENGEPARVSPYRLAAHLGSAFTLYLITLATGVRILAKTRAKPFSVNYLNAQGKETMNSIRKWTHGVAGMTFATAMTGAFVAGLDAGMIYNSFPMMGDRWVPTDIWEARLGWRNLTENPTTVQFIHRYMAISTVTAVSALWLKARALPLPRPVKRAFHLMMGMAWAQGSLGLLTLLYVVPIPLASAHQAGSLALLSSFVWLINVMKRVPK